MSQTLECAFKGSFKNDVTKKGTGGYTKLVTQNDNGGGGCPKKVMSSRKKNVIKFLNDSNRYGAKKRTSSAKLFGGSCLGGAIEIFTGWWCTKFIQHLQKGAKQFCKPVQRERVGGYDQKRVHAYKGQGWSKSGDFERTYFLKYLLKGFKNQTMACLIKTASHIANNRQKQTDSFKLISCPT